MLSTEHVGIRFNVRQILDAASAAKPPPPEVDVAQQIANYIYTHEAANNGRFMLVDGRPCLFTGIDLKLLEIAANSRPWNAHIVNLYGLNAKSKITTFITQFLESHCVWHGERRNAQRWVSFQREDQALYISNYDGHNYRVAGDGVDVHADAQGHLHVTDDIWAAPGYTHQGTVPVGIGVAPNGSIPIFADDDGGVPCVSPHIGRNSKLFKLVANLNWARTTVGGLTCKHQMQALIIWMFAVAFPELFPTKPLLILEGSPGSGKTSALQMIQMTLHGKELPITISKNDQQNFKIQLLRNPIALLDNLDDFIDWMPNTIAAYATGAGWIARELYTNAGEILIRPQSFVVVASKNPTSFRQDDVADRSILLRAERRKDFTSMQVLKGRILASREEAYGEWLYYLNRIVAVLNSGLVPQTATHRMADFETFAWAVGYALNWKPYIVPELMDALQRERVAFASENDIVVELLEQWLEQAGNEMRMVTARMLFKELENLAECDGKKFLRNPMALALRLRAPHVVQRFTIEDELQDAHGRKIYQIGRPLEPLAQAN